jgi:hypothetical protein
MTSGIAFSACGRPVSALSLSLSFSFGRDFSLFTFTFALERVHLKIFRSNNDGQLFLQLQEV